MAGRGRQRAGRPRIYGDETKCRAAIVRYIADGQELLDQTDGVRNRFAHAKAEKAKAKPKPAPKPPAKPRSKAPPALVEPFLPRLIEFTITTREFTDNEWLDVIARDWLNSARSWRDRASKRMQGYLQEQVHDLVPALAAGPGRFSDGSAETWLRDAVAQFRHLQEALGVQRAIPTSAEGPTRFAELLASGLVEAKLVRDKSKTVSSSLRTAKQRADAIGAAKELTEATLRGALVQLRNPPKPKVDLQDLMKAWRVEMGLIAPTTDGADVLTGALNGQIRLLAEWRNKYGSGHGRPSYSPGVKARHARLTIDAAETCIRFVVKTMDDLQLLPP